MLASLGSCVSMRTSPATSGSESSPARVYSSATPQAIFLELEEILVERDYRIVEKNLFDGTLEAERSAETYQNFLIWEWRRRERVVASVRQGLWGDGSLSVLRLGVDRRIMRPLSETLSGDDTFDGRMERQAILSELDSRLKPVSTYANH